MFTLEQVSKECQAWTRETLYSSMHRGQDQNYGWLKLLRELGAGDFTIQLLFFFHYIAIGIWAPVHMYNT